MGISKVLKSIILAALLLTSFPLVNGKFDPYADNGGTIVGKFVQMIITSNEDLQLIKQMSFQCLRIVLMFGNHSDVWKSFWCLESTKRGVIAHAFLHSCEI